MTTHMLFKTNKYLFKLNTFVSLLLLAAPAVAQEVRPNFIVIVSDDQRYDQLTDQEMPITMNELVQKGTRFSKAYITNPPCCPSRAAILTGSYSSRNKVYGNRYPLSDDHKTVAHFLQSAGYTTGLVGKYLNSWNGTPRAEYDYWLSHSGALAAFENPTLNENGTFKQFKGYTTNILTRHAYKFIESAHTQRKPFFLFLTPNAPHAPAIPEAKYKNYFSDIKAPRPPNYNIPPSNKPAHMQHIKKLSKSKQLEIDEFYRNQLRTLRSLDDGIGVLLELLDEKSILENTVLFFISDNGVFLGEFRLRGKSRVYEPAIRVPFVMRYDRACTAGLKSDALVANIDITPTILHIAGIPIPAYMDGKSLQPLCTGNAQSVRKQLLIESWGNRGKRGNRGFMALHTGDTVYVENEDDLSEYYILSDDPHQLNNRISIGNYLATIAKQRHKLHQLVRFVRGSLSYAINVEEVPGFSDDTDEDSN